MKWKAQSIDHKGEKRIAIYFESSPELNSRIKKLAGIQWSRTLKVWHVPDTLAYRQQFKIEGTENKQISEVLQ